jgi:hypothetical protein
MDPTTLIFNVGSTKLLICPLWLMLIITQHATPSGDTNAFMDWITLNYVKLNFGLNFPLDFGLGF